MSRFNVVSNTGTPDAVTSEGVPAFQKSPELELVTMLLTSFATDKFYSTGDQQMNRVRTLVRAISAVDPLFSAKAAIYARDTFGMRTIAQVVAVELAPFISKAEWASRFYEKLVVRPDDMTEVVSLYLARNPKPQGKRHAPFPNAMKRGFARALASLDAHRLAKYKAEGKGVKLVDLANLFHPKSNEQLAALVGGSLKPADTWEVASTKAGQEAADVKAAALAEGKSEAEAALAAAGVKTDAWMQLVLGRQLGHFALLRNLRNIRDKAPGVMNIALEQLKIGVGKARVFPYRYLVAGDQFAGEPGQINADVCNALVECVNGALGGVPVMPGRTLVAVDNSASMTSAAYRRNGKGMESDTPARKAAVFGAAIALTSPSDLMVFSDSGIYVRLVKGTPLTTAASLILQSIHSAGTDFRPIFATNEKYDRFIILTDNEAQTGGRVANEFLRDYRKRTGADPQVFIFDLAGSGTVQFPERNLYVLAGFSEKVFDLMAKLGEDREAMLNAVRAVSI